MVFGYLRNEELSLNDEIPMDVKPILLSYCCNREYFANAHSDFRVVDSVNETSIERTDNYEYASAFGNVLIRSHLERVLVYVWKLRILEMASSSLLSIGITTEYNCTQSDFRYYTNGQTYNVDATGCFWHNTKLQYDVGETFYNPGDIVTLTLNLKNKTLNYKAETDEDGGFDLYEGEGFENIACGVGINYKMAVCSFDPKDKIELVDFYQQ